MTPAIDSFRRWPSSFPVFFLVLVLACSEKKPLLELHACDSEAAHPDDPDKWDVGLADEDIIPGRAVAACRAAVEDHPATARFHFQLGRALWASGHIEDGLESFLDASDAGYAPAYHYLAHAYRVGLVPNEGIDLDFATELSDRAVAGGFHVENEATPLVAATRQSRPDDGRRQETSDVRSRAGGRSEVSSHSGEEPDAEQLLDDMIGTTTLESASSYESESELVESDDAGHDIRGWETSSAKLSTGPESSRRDQEAREESRAVDPEPDESRSEKRERAQHTDHGVVVFSEPYYQGRSELLTTDDRDLADNTIGAKAVSSIRVARGCSAVLFTKVDFEGRSRSVSEDNPDLRRRFRDRLVKIHQAGSDSTSSIKIHCDK